MVFQYCGFILPSAMVNPTGFRQLKSGSDAKMMIEGFIRLLCTRNILIRIHSFMFIVLISILSVKQLETISSTMVSPYFDISQRS